MQLQYERWEVHAGIALSITPVTESQGGDLVNIRINLSDNWPTLNWWYDIGQESANTC
jgi:hypothetical protein